MQRGWDRSKKHREYSQTQIERGWSKYDKVFCVFDRDNDLSSFLEAIEQCKSRKFIAIVSNPLREIIAKQLTNLPKEEQQISANAMENQMKRCNSRWFRYYLTYDPKISLKHLKIPVLVINGELDSQVSPKQNLPVIAKILEKAENQNYKIIEFPKLNHFFQTCETGSILEYGKIEETIAPVVLETLSDWILETTTNLGKR